eukprot:gnl/TRDRNA2_/TRDRNA2_139582_c1_seq1.p1 gnl/TRDRNA2_/TRDRNA2_139582_c1~~gnl/TRDRNA2_/TRDRNA2_139582_c1_seq1.p1  ORF type:complete len:502 (-),score=107.10 gnl/TRDRNA2_/TRDRNA2_139582_c1_seq1:96-1601(-)
MMEKPSTAWQRRRHEKAQEFLDRFARQNIAEIDELPIEDETITLQMTPAQHIMYLELDAQIQAQDIPRRRRNGTMAVGSTRNLSDREGRVKALLGGSSSSDEALLKFTANLQEKAEKSCKELVTARKEELDACMRELVRVYHKAQALQMEIGREDPGYECTHFRQWKTQAAGCGDEDTSKKLLELVQPKGSDPKNATAAGSKRKNTGGKESESPRKRRAGPAVRDQDEDEDEKAKDKKSNKKLDLREMVYELSKLDKELMSRQRALRFIENAQLLMNGGNPTKCSGGLNCHHASENPAFGILSCCGHVGDMASLESCAKNCSCPAKDCKVAARCCNIISGQVLRGAQRGRRDMVATKLQYMLKIIQSVPRNERVLVFTQFHDLEESVAKFLKSAGVEYLQLDGSVHKKVGTVHKFQDEADYKGARVLLLNVSQESASGMNLTTANHCIFLHPLLAQSQGEYDAWMTQAIGRIRRFGQTRKCHVYRLECADTIDKRISELRQ